MNDTFLDTCQSPFGGDIMLRHEVLSLGYTVAMFIGSVVGLIKWKERSWHPWLIYRGQALPHVLVVCSVFYGFFFKGLFFVEPQPFNVCFLVMFAGMLTACQMWPLFFLCLSAINKSIYHQALANFYKFDANQSWQTTGSHGTSGKADLLNTLKQYKRCSNSTYLFRLMWIVVSIHILISFMYVTATCSRFSYDGECHFFDAQWSRPTTYWLLTLLPFLYLKYKARTQIHTILSEYGVDRQMHMNKYYLGIPTFIIYIWILVDPYTTEFLEPNPGKRLGFTQFDLLDICGCTCVYINIYWPLKKSYNGLTKEILKERQDQAMSLEEILNDEAACAEFEKCLRRFYCDENLNFYKVVTKFEENESVSLKHTARNIYKFYCAPGSSSEINISSETRALIKKRVMGNLSVHNDCFAEAKEEIFGILRQDCRMKFLATKEYAEIRANYKPLTSPESFI